MLPKTLYGDISKYTCILLYLLKYPEDTDNEATTNVSDVTKQENLRMMLNYMYLLTRVSLQRFRLERQSLMHSNDPFCICNVQILDQAPCTFIERANNKEDIGPA